MKRHQYSHKLFGEKSMRFKRTATALAVIALGIGSAHAEGDSMFKFSGFGTLSAVHSSERQADFVGNFAQPNGAGYTSSTSLAPDSKLGLQLNATLSDKWSSVVQLVSKHQYDNSYTPNIEWANIKYQLTPELSVRLGRTALPTYLVAETRLVGYANPTVRPPLEVYGAMPITTKDGLDASYRSTIGAVNNTLQALYGRTTIDLPHGDLGKGKNIWGINDSVDIGSLTLRAGIVSAELTIQSSGVNQLLDGFSQFAAGVSGVPLPAYQAAAARAREILQTYSPNGIKYRVFNIGATYDPGDWFVTSEIIRVTTTSFSSDITAWYATGGYRFGNLTPYVTLASEKRNIKLADGIPTTGLDPQSAAGATALSGGINAVINAFAWEQSTAAVGLRWDFMPNVALKTQFDRTSLGKASAGHLGNIQPGFVPGGKVSLFTVALDFVF